MSLDRRLDNSRRSFLKLGAAAFAGATLTRSLPVFAANADEFGGLPIGIQSYTLRSMSLEKALDAMNNPLGIKEVELFPGHHPGMSPKALKQLLNDKGIKAVSYGVVGFGKDHNANRTYFEFAKEMGMKNLSCDPENDPACFESVGKLCDEFGITAAIHPHGPGSRWVKIDQIWNAIKDVNPKIGLNNETGWLIAADEDPVRACDVFKGRMYAMHLKDFKKKDGGGLEDVPAGQGQLNVDALVKKLLEQKFNGALSIEYEGGEPVEAVMKSLARIKEAVKKAQAA